MEKCSADPSNSAIKKKEIHKDKQYTAKTSLNENSEITELLPISQKVDKIAPYQKKRYGEI